MIDEQRQMKLMAYLDGELDDAERQGFERDAATDPELTRMIEEFRALAEQADSLQLPEPPPEVWDRYWDEVHSRLGRRFGWTFMACGAGIVGAFILWRLFCGDCPPVMKWGIGLGLTGAAVLFVAVLRARVREMKNDRYRKVKH